MDLGDSDDEAPDMQGLVAVPAAIAVAHPLALDSKAKLQAAISELRQRMPEPDAGTSLEIGEVLHRAGSMLQRISHAEHFQDVCELSRGIESLFQQYLYSERSRLISDAALSDATGLTRKTVKQRRIRLGAGLHAGMHSAANKLFESACRKVLSQGGRCITLFEVHRGDETEFARLGIGSLFTDARLDLEALPDGEGGDPEDGAIALQRAEESASAGGKTFAAPQCKIFQSELKIAGLFESRGHFFLLSIDIPTPLQAYDSSVADVALAGARALSFSFPAGRLFCRVQRLVTADGANSIAKSERAYSKMMKDDGTAEVESMQMWCLIHRMYKTIGHPLKRFPSYITGIIRWALSLRGSGHFVSFVRHLRQEIESTLDYRYDQPGAGADADAYRNAIFDAFIPSGRLGSKQHRLRRFCVARLINGDIRLTDCVQHFCKPGCCIDRRDCVNKVKRFLVPALAGCLPPVFRRERWTGNDAALNYVGLLEAVHGLLSRAYRSWYQKETGRHPPPLHADLLEQHLGLADAAVSEFAVDSGDDESGDAGAGDQAEWS